MELPQYGKVSQQGDVSTAGSYSAICASDIPELSASTHTLVVPPNVEVRVQESRQVRLHTSYRKATIPLAKSLLVVIAVVVVLGIIAAIRYRVFTAPTTSISTVSMRAQENYLKPGLSYTSAFFKAAMNPYDSKSNIDGDLPLAVAENNLMREELIQKLSRFSFSNYSMGILNYAAAPGMMTLRETLASFLSTHVFKHSGVSPSDVLVSGGVTPLLSQLSLLLFDAGDSG